MANRHKAQFAKGGGVAPKHDADKKEYDGVGSNVMAEAKKTGAKRGGKVHGHKGKHRLDKRARGGGVGADRTPFSSAHVAGHAGGATNPEPHKGGE